MKKIIAFLVTAILLLTLVTVPASAAGSGTLAMSSASAKQGGTVTLNVNMNKNPGLVTLAISVEYDTSVLQLTKVTDSGLVVGSQLNTSYSSPYKITWVDGAATKNNTKTGKIASFTFKVKDNAKVGATNVVLKFSESYDSNYGENSFSATSGKVTVTCKSHSFGAYTKVSDSQHSRTCSVCKKVESRDIKATGHKFSDAVVTKKPTCTEKGKETGTCTVCGAKTEQDIKKLPHSYGEAVVTKEPTETETGISTKTCKDCGHKAEEELPIKGTASAPETSEPTTSTPEQEDSSKPSGGETDTDKSADATLPWILFGATAVIAVAEAIALIVLAKKKKSA